MTMNAQIHMNDEKANYSVVEDALTTRYTLVGRSVYANTKHPLASIVRFSSRTLVARILETCDWSRMATHTR